MPPKKKRFQNLSERIRAIPTQRSLTADELQALFLQHLMDADLVAPTKEEALYAAKTQAIVALANLVTKQKDQASLDDLNSVLDEEDA